MQEEDAKAVADPPKPDFWRDPRPTNENPNFVRDYFASSRLHFIGSFRARYEAMMVAVAANLAVNPRLLLQSSAEKGLLSAKAARAERIIVHIDMDCFFASIAVKKNPALAGKPIAVCHGGGEISSCSYEARKFGVRAGTFFRDGRKLCPDLLSVPYEFPMYEEASLLIYAIFYSSPSVCVEAVSVDEAYLDVTLAIGDERHASQSGADALVRNLRDKIFASTGCTASAGIGPSKLVARLATKAAKPNGQMRVRQENVIAYLDMLQVKDLPGIGWRTGRRLREKGITTVPQLRALSLAELQSEFGGRQGQVFYNLARALDARPVEPLKPRKSIGAEASWGVRFTKEEEDKARKFIMDMADEVAARVEAAGAYGTKVVFKEYKRKKNASMVGYKHLGHGPCVVFTRSAKMQTRSAGRPLNELLRQACLRLHNDLGLRSDELRGVGVQMTDLSFADLNFDHAEATTAGSTRRIDSFFETAVPSSIGNGLSVSQRGKATNETIKDLPSSRNGLGQVSKQSKGGAFDEEEPLAVEFVKKHSERMDASKERVASPIDEQIERHLADIEDEDRIEPAPAQVEFQRAPQLKDAVAEAHEGGELDIPKGWDRGVFRNLPKDLQDELLKSSSHGIAAGHPPPREAEAVTDDTSTHRIAPPKRRRNPKPKPAGAQAERAKRRKAAQVTMTQFADISNLKKRGHNVLDAEEFREMPLRDCVELLGDLRGKPLNVRTLQTDRRKVGTETTGRGEEEEDELEDLEIPSPPSLSSDSDGSCSMTEMVLRHGFEEGLIYAEEELSSYAEVLRLWMRTVAGEAKSGHVELIRGRVLELLRRKRLERVCSEMRLVRLFVGEEGMGAWVGQYNKILDDVQEECRVLYKFRLALRKA